MKTAINQKTLLAFCLFSSLFLSTLPAHAFGFEAAGGMWLSGPSGEISYGGEGLTLEEELGFDRGSSYFGRARLDIPLLPDIYLMATPLRFEGMSEKEIDFHFGDGEFKADSSYSALARVDHFDIALVYGVPLIETATAGALKIDLGIDLRVFDVEASIRQGALRESREERFAILLLYAGFGLEPVERFSIEGEMRGMLYGSDYYADVIGRVKYRFVENVFLAGGLRYERIEFDKEGLGVEVGFGGPFLEAGVEF